MVKREYRTTFVLVTSLFFIWGFTRAIMDVLNKHFQTELGISISQSTWMQVAFFLGYFLFALPAGRFITRYGYRNGVVFGLSLFGMGALAFGVWAAFGGSVNLSLFYFFLLALFVIACGLVVLETAANPYVTLLGNRETSASRLNFAQSFNGLGNICGPWIGGMLLFTGGDADITLPYILLGMVVFLVALVFSRVKLPEIQEEEWVNPEVKENKGLWHHRLFVFGFIALLFYEIAEISINSLFVNYAESAHGIDKLSASQWLSFGFVLFMVARFVGSWLMSKLKAEKVLLGCAIGTVMSNILVFINIGMISLIALMLNFVFEAIIFPTIFSLALQDLGNLTKKGSAVLMMSTIGGAIGTWLMGTIADQTTLSFAFIVPLIGYLVVLAYSIKVTR